MALPKATETPRTRQLQNIVDKLKPEELAGWPGPTKDDFALIGCLVVQFSYIDLSLRRIVEMLDREKMLSERFQEKSAYLSITKVQDAVMEQDWAGPNMVALKRIEEFRTVRNIVAHFAVKRFPTEDAFVFVTKSASDFKQVFGNDPPPGVALNAVADAPQLRSIVAETENLLSWLAKATVEFEFLRQDEQRSKPNV